MLKYYFVAVLLFISPAVFSNHRYKNQFDVEGVAIKTDVLTLLNSAINKGFNSYSLSGELYFNKQFSIGADFVSASTTLQNDNRNEQRFGSQFRWYFKQDDCNCSAFFAGSYFSYSKNTETLNQNLQLNNNLQITKTYFEGGLTGGLQAIFADHFLLDPAVEIGMEFSNNFKNNENNIYPIAKKEKVLLVKILFGIGYRF